MNPKTSHCGKGQCEVCHSTDYILAHFNNVCIIIINLAVYMYCVNSQVHFCVSLNGLLKKGQSERRGPSSECDGRRREDVKTANRP